MESYRTRVLTARLMLGASALLALGALVPPWMVFRLSELSHDRHTSLADVTVRIPDLLRENAVHLTHDFSHGGLAAGLSLIVWATLFAFLLSSPFLVGFYSRARVLQGVAKGMALALFVPLGMMLYVLGRTYYYSAGAGVWLFAVAVVLHAAGLVVIPRFPAGEPVVVEH